MVRANGTTPWERLGISEGRKGVPFRTKALLTASGKGEVMRVSAVRPNSKGGT